jgi:hypothetical protein
MRQDGAFVAKCIIKKESGSKLKENKLIIFLEMLPYPQHPSLRYFLLLRR